MPGPRECDSPLQPPCSLSAAQASGTVPFMTEGHWEKRRKTCPVTWKNKKEETTDLNTQLPRFSGRRARGGPGLCDSKTRRPGGRLPENQLGVPRTSCYQVCVPQEETV